MKIIGIILGALGLYVCVMNYIGIGVSLYNKKHGIDRFISSVPLVAGIMMFISAVILLPKNVWALGFLAFLLLLRQLNVFKRRSHKPKSSRKSDAAVLYVLQGALTQRFSV